MGGLVWFECIIGLRCYGYKVNLFILLLNLNLLGNLNAMRDVRIIALTTDKLVWSVIKLINFYKTLSALNRMNVKMVNYFYFKSIKCLVAIYKWLSGTISLCGSECPANCIFILLNYFIY